MHPWIRDFPNGIRAVGAGRSAALVGLVWLACPLGACKAPDRPTSEPELIILGRDGRAPDVTTTELPADGGEPDTGPDGDAFVLPDAGLRSCRPGRPTIQTADLVYPARVPVAGLQERYEFVGLLIAASEVLTPPGCCPLYPTYDWEAAVEPADHLTLMYVTQSFFDENVPENGGPRDGPESPDAAIFLVNAEHAPTRIGLVALVTAKTGSECPDGRVTEELRSEPLWIDFAPSTFFEDGE